MIDDPSTVLTRHAIGVEKILFKSDYLHGDGIWPGTQAVMKKLIGGLSEEEIRVIAHETAAELYRQPRPPNCVPWTFGTAALRASFAWRIHRVESVHVRCPVGVDDEGRVPGDFPHGQNSTDLRDARAGPREGAGGILPETAPCVHAESRCPGNRTLRRVG